MRTASPFFIDRRCNAPFSIDDGQLDELRVQHKQECKGLVVQIRYLKAKFTRESTLRDDLSYQKQYLLVLLASFEARYRGHAFACSLDLTRLRLATSVSWLAYHA